ncbi:MAG TPA: hypothetical protein VHB21_24115 [Minicystis sp.]|nr:hypothetical protein [Minicystis sp.]
MADARVACAAAIALAVAACAEAPPPPPAPRPLAPPPVAAAPDFAGAKLGVYRSRRFQIALPLPDGHAWHIDDHGGTWLVAKHAPTGSELDVRVWAEDGRANTKTCEESARVWRKLPEREGADVVDRLAIDAPAGFDTHADLLVFPTGAADAPLRAAVIAFGGRMHRCFAYVFTTVAKGPDAERAAGARLAAIVQRSLRDVTSVDELNPRAREASPLEEGLPQLQRR